MAKPVLLVDFDGVIHSYTSGWQGVAVVADPPVPGALQFLADATRVFDVCIYSSRSKDAGGRQAMKDWLRKHDDAVIPRMDPAIIDGTIRFPLEKPAAFLTIDDRCICFTGDFPNPEELLHFKPWNKPT
jgi:hypothetical protein